jgi:hypothetical protein
MVCLGPAPLAFDCHLHLKCNLPGAPAHRNINLNPMPGFAVLHYKGAPLALPTTTPPQPAQTPPWTFVQWNQVCRDAHSS